ncbi:IclR family transcriptional regulator [Amycolatopsis pithecellobii]|uniref:Helix-turn-helix domain-containing protein n=1 Tax=Amycolatopsis pithecellobii TaxID=664692 RepID=A0A6N7Z2T7_9PSEU|nr:IclR family transcriptional regulator [Amycolatopsis pithecellobii]MTD56063.1 helix-turn-helix domain-containing protein [Amycolatopsis pithecellobii]
MQEHDDVRPAVASMDTSASGVTERVARLLLAFLGTEGHLTLPELMRRTGLPKSTTYRMVNDLIEYGLLERTAGGSVMPAMSMFELGLLTGRFRHLREGAAPVMQQLYDEFRQVVHLGVLTGIDVLYLLKIGGRPGSVLPTRDGGRMPAYLTGLGKAMIAFMPDPEIGTFIGTVLTEVPEIGCDPSAPWGELRKIQKYGIAFDSEEAVRGINCVAAPIFLPGTHGTAAVSVTGPIRSFDLRRAANSVALAAATVTRALGVRRTYNCP